MSVSDSPEVLLEKMASGPMCAAAFSRTIFLIFMSSLTTSMTQSASCRRGRSSSRLPVSMRDMRPAVNRGEGLVFFMAATAVAATPFLCLGSSPASAGTMSSTSDAIPALAKWAAMALPMTPEPSTATFLICLRMCSAFHSPGGFEAEYLILINE